MLVGQDLATVAQSVFILLLCIFLLILVAEAVEGWLRDSGRK